MYAIYGNIYHQYTPNVSIHTIHGSYRIYIYICTKQTCGCFVKWVYPQSSILIGVSIVNHPAIGAPPFMENAIHETMLKDSFVLYPFHPMSIFSHREGCFALQSFGSNFSSRRLADGSLQGSWMVQFMQHTSYN